MERARLGEGLVCTDDLGVLCPEESIRPPGAGAKGKQSPSAALGRKWMGKGPQTWQKDHLVSFRNGASECFCWSLAAEPGYVRCPGPSSRASPGPAADTP